MQRSETQALHRRRHRLHVSVRAGARDLEGLLERHEGLALQRAADDLHQGIGQMREITQRLILDGAAFAVATTEQMGAIGLILVVAGRSDDVGGASTCSHRLSIA